MNIEKAIIPVAGLGKRFAPISRTIPKAMMPLLDRPVLDYAISEALNAGITEIFIIISPSQYLIIDYYENDPNLPLQSAQTQARPNIEKTVFLKNSVRLHFIIQEKPLGLGNAILVSKQCIGKDPFTIILPDDLIFTKNSPISSMIEFFKLSNSSIIAVREVPNQLINQFGIVEIRHPNQLKDNFYEVTSMVEKPALSETTSNLAIVGRYVLLPSIFDSLEKTSPGVNNEIQLTDAISSLIPTHQTYAFYFEGHHFDVGNPKGLLEASNYIEKRQNLDPVQIQNCY